MEQQELINRAYDMMKRGNELHIRAQNILESIKNKAEKDTQRTNKLSKKRSSLTLLQRQKIQSKVIPNKRKK